MSSFLGRLLVDAKSFTSGVSRFATVRAARSQQIFVCNATTSPSLHHTSLDPDTFILCKNFTVGVSKCITTIFIFNEDYKSYNQPL